MRKKYTKRNFEQEKSETLSLYQQAFLNERLKAGLTQSKFAELVGISKSYVAQIETGQKEPSARLMELVRRIALGDSKSETLQSSALVKEPIGVYGSAEKDQMILATQRELRETQRELRETQRELREALAQLKERVEMTEPQRSKRAAG